MANLDADDITVTMINQRRVNGRSHNVVKLVFGANSDTYGAGGIPISKGKLGCPNVIESLTVFDSGTSAYKWSYDRANEKLIAMQAPAQTHAHDIKVIGSASGGIDEPLGVEGGDTLAKDAATNRTIAGADSATKGGVMSATLSAAGLVEPSTVDIATQTLYCEVVGW